MAIKSQPGNVHTSTHVCQGHYAAGVGAVDVQDPDLESGETVAARIAKYKGLAPEQTIITSSCGFNHLPRSVAAGKLRAMTKAKRILGG